jgi:deazaflavin-dependent oxidoreductase (nitroreductase family)
MADEPLEPRADWVREHQRRYLASNGADGHEWQSGVPTLLLTTRGRRSGHLRRTPLIYGRDDGRYLVVASYGGSPQHPDWYFNLDADPAVTIQVGDRVMTARARPASDEERASLWSVMTAIWPAYDEYQGRTSRTIPVVIIEPD